MLRTLTVDRAANRSVALLRLNDDGRITLPHFVSWYTDAGVVRNVFAEFDADADQKL